MSCATTDVGRHVVECDGVFVRICPRGSPGYGDGGVIDLDGDDLARMCDLAEARGIELHTLAVQRAEDRADDYDRLYREVCFDADALLEERTELRRKVLDVLRPLVNVSEPAAELVAKLEGAIKAEGGNPLADMVAEGAAREESPPEV